MKHHYGWDVEQAEDMVPWEWEVYVDLTMDHVRKIREAREKASRRA